MNSIDFLEIATAICPDRNIVIFENESTTYSQFKDRVERLAKGLKALGIEKGDRVGMLQVNCPQYLEAYFATARTGAIFVPLNFRAKADELTYMINNAQTSVLFAGARYLDMVREILPKLPCVENCVIVDQRAEGFLHFEDLMKSTSEEFSIDVEDEDITIIMYTAGTTGRPKGVPLRNEGFTSYILENVGPADPEIEERNLLTVPLYHVAGMQAVLAGVYGGRTLVLMRQFEVKEWLRTVQAQRVSRAMLVPTMLKWVIDDPDFGNYDLSSLKVITYGAAPMPLNVIEKAVRVLPGVQFINAFGQTETASTITSLGPEDHVIEGSPEEKAKKLKRLANSIGKPLSDVQIRIVDPNGSVLPEGEVGEIQAKGARIMKGYWGDEEKSALAITPDGWLRTGDRGWMDQDGYIYLAGRGDDVIIRGGENISPEEVEDVLHSHPKIDEAAVIGIPDPEWGQEPRAIVVMKKGESADPEDIIQFCRERLAGFKRPRSVVFVDSLPRNHMGKVLRRELRKSHGES